MASSNDVIILLDWSSSIVSIDKTASKKIGTLICFVKFGISEIVLYKSIIQPQMQYCYHIWAGTPDSFVYMFDKLQKQSSVTKSVYRYY